MVELDKLKEVADEVIKEADTDKDGKVSFFEMINFFVTNPVYIFLAIAVLSLSPIKDFLLVGFNEGIWDITSLLNTILAAITSLIFYLVMKSLDKNTQNVINTMTFQYDDKIKTITTENTNLKEENAKLKGTINDLLLEVKLKEQEINLTQKKLIN